MKKIFEKIRLIRPILLLGIFFVLTSKLSFSSELYFSGLVKFGAVAIYLAVLVELIQKIIVAMVIIGIINDVLEVVATADFSKLLRSTFMGMLYIYISTVLVRLIISIGRGNATDTASNKALESAGTITTNSAGGLANSFKFVFTFLGWVQYTTAALVISCGILFFIVGMFKYIANADIVQLVQTLIMTGLFLMAFVSIIGNSINKTDGSKPKGILNTVRTNGGGKGVLISAVEINVDDILKLIEQNK